MEKTTATKVKRTKRTEGTKGSLIGDWLSRKIGERRAKPEEKPVEKVEDKEKSVSKSKSKSKTATKTEAKTVAMSRGRRQCKRAMQPETKGKKCAAKGKKVTKGCGCASML